MVGGLWFWGGCSRAAWGPATGRSDSRDHGCSQSPGQRWQIVSCGEGMAVDRLAHCEPTHLSTRVMRSIRRLGVVRSTVPALAAGAAIMSRLVAAGLL